MSWVKVWVKVCLPVISTIGQTCPLGPPWQSVLSPHGNPPDLWRQHIRPDYIFSSIRNSSSPDGTVFSYITPLVYKFSKLSNMTWDLGDKRPRFELCIYQWVVFHQRSWTEAFMYGKWNVGHRKLVNDEMLHKKNVLLLLDITTEK